MESVSPIWLLVLIFNEMREFEGLIYQRKGSRLV